MLLKGLTQDDRVRCQLVAWRHHVEPLPCGKGHHVFMVPGDAPHAARGRLPPLLGQQKGLVQHVERPQTPLVGLEATILCRRQNAKTWLLRTSCHAVLDVAPELFGLGQRQAAQVEPLAGRHRQVQGPVEQRQLHRYQRQRTRRTCKRSVKRWINQLGSWGRRHGGGAHARGVKRLQICNPLDASCRGTNLMHLKPRQECRL